MATTDVFYPEAGVGPATSAAAVTPYDVNQLATVTRALWVGGAGDLRVKLLDGQTVTIPSANVGWHPLRVRQVFATGTTATNIVATW
jgi:hypothetical protein